MGKSIDTDVNSFKQALIYQGKFGLKPKDSIIYSAVVAHLRQQPYEVNKCFLNRNVKDFNDANIVAELKSFNCRYIDSFTHGLNYLQRKLRDEEA